MEDHPIRFNTYEGLTSIADYHRKVGSCEFDLDLMLERSVRTPLIPAKLKELVIFDLKPDFTGLGKYMSSQSWATVEVNGKEEQWPLTMIYVKTNA